MLVTTKGTTNKAERLRYRVSFASDHVLLLIKVILFSRYSLNPICVDRQCIPAEFHGTVLKIKLLLKAWYLQEHLQENKVFFFWKYTKPGRQVRLNSGLTWFYWRVNAIITSIPDASAIFLFHVNKEINSAPRKQRLLNLVSIKIAKLIMANFKIDRVSAYTFYRSVFNLLCFFMEALCT